MKVDLYDAFLGQQKWPKYLGGILEKMFTIHEKSNILAPTGKS